MSQTETRAMLRNVIFKLKETKTHAEIMGWLVAEAVTILKDLSFSEPDFKAKQVQAKPATIREDPATGPERQVWVAPTNGFWRHDGRFVPSADWKPVEKPVAEEPTPVEPKRMIAWTLPNGMTKLYEDTPAFRAQRAKEEKELTETGCEACICTTACDEGCDEYDGTEASSCQYSRRSDVTLRHKLG